MKSNKKKIYKLKKKYFFFIFFLFFFYFICFFPYELKRILSVDIPSEINSYLSGSFKIKSSIFFCHIFFVALFLVLPMFHDLFSFITHRTCLKGLDSHEPSFTLFCFFLSLSFQSFLFFFFVFFLLFFFVF